MFFLTEQYTYSAVSLGKKISFERKSNKINSFTLEMEKKFHKIAKTYDKATILVKLMKPIKILCDTSGLPEKHFL